MSSFAKRPTVRSGAVVGAVSVALGTAALLALPVAVYAQQAADEPIERIEITGSSIKRVASEAALPVTVITRSDIEKSGANTAEQLLDKIVENTGGGYSQSLAIGDAARPGFSGASLRGLSSNFTLVLLNGRRLAVFAFDGGGVDLNSIALGAIDRIEVLRDGASAIYGSDAIGGVINFITRKDYQGLDLSATFDKPDHAGGSSESYNLTFGYGDIGSQRFNLLGNLSLDRAYELKSADRPFSNSAYLPNAPGGKIDKTSGNAFPATINVPGVGTVNGAACIPPYSFPTTTGGACRFNYAAVIDDLPPQDKIAGLLRGVFKIAQDHEAFAEYNRTVTRTVFKISPTPASGGTTFNGDPVLYPAGGPWYPKAINPATGTLQNGVINQKTGAFVPLSGNLSLNYRILDGGPRTDQSEVSQDRWVFGVKGTVFGLDYETGFSRSVSRAADDYVTGYFSESKLLNSVGGLPPTDPNYVAGTLNPLINPFGFNNAAGLAALQAAKVLGDTRISESMRQGWDAKISGDIDQLKLWGGPVGFALGGEIHRERYSDDPLPVLNSGDIIASGGNVPTAFGSRNVQAAFGELSLPILHSLEGLVQLRYDHYSDFGNSTTPKFGLKFTPIPQVALRASYSRGFAAPTLPDLYQPQSQTNSGGTYNDPFYEAKVGPCFTAAGVATANFNPAYCQAQLHYLNGGNPHLDAQKSSSRNFGIVLEPSKKFSASIDYYRISLRNLVATPDADNLITNFLTPFLDPATLANGYDPTTAQLSAAGKAALQSFTGGSGVTLNKQGYWGEVNAFYANIATESTNGYDFNIKAEALKNQYGTFRVNADATYIAAFDQNDQSQLGQYLLYGPISRFQTVDDLNWESGDWNADLIYNYKSTYLDYNGKRDVAGYIRWDLGANYTGFRNLRLHLGMLNMFDRDPPFSNQTKYFQIGYDPTYADPRGRTFVLSARYVIK
jgi:iron complex outermembrane recepter protein